MHSGLARPRHAAADSVVEWFARADALGVTIAELLKDQRYQQPFVEALYRLLRQIVGRMPLPQHADRDDLVQAGILAAMTSSDRIDPSRSLPERYRFLLERCTRAITDAQRDKDSLTRSQRDAHRAAQQALADASARAARRGGSGQITAAEQDAVVASARGSGARDDTRLVARYGTDVLSFDAPRTAAAPDETMFSRCQENAVRMAVFAASVGWPECSLCARALRFLARGRNLDALPGGPSNPMPRQIQDHTHIVSMLVRYQALADLAGG